MRLRHEHRADLVHLFTGEHPALRVRGFGAICGLHRQLTKGLTAFNFSPAAYGWTVNYPSSCGDYAVTFAHEIGHGLGAHHDPANVRRPERLFRPYAIGHANFDVMPSIGTAMSYRGQIEPFFSTPRIRPYGAVVGVAEEQDNERRCGRRSTSACSTATTCGLWRAFRRSRAIFGFGSTAAPRVSPGGTTRRARTATRWSTCGGTPQGVPLGGSKRSKAAPGRPSPSSTRNRVRAIASWSEQPWAKSGRCAVAKSRSSSPASRSRRRRTLS